MKIHLKNSARLTLLLDNSNDIGNTLKKRAIASHYYWTIVTTLEIHLKNSARLTLLLDNSNEIGNTLKKQRSLYR
ncbi:MAG: hypothetical protein F6K54_11000 [Okeania sp. SIO3B5]|uniref:hypothetical protein n=1 Tax=Okeania sp. SIO3B5 TaxID=2607811 RepID=UPI00140090C4|nr:hypothetical protein [Okeania sp. SIO3B5]NEO53561.1 hypothetical protein [Okeania sp. SIO3B5]